MLETLPKGAVCKFADVPDSAIIKTYSYFSLTPFGYANFGPLIAAVLTAAMLIAGILYSLNGKNGLLTAHRCLTAAALGASALPAVMFGTEYLTDVGAMITLTLAAQAIISFIFLRKTAKKAV